MKEHRDGGYIFLDAVVTLFIIVISFSGLLSFESLLLRALGEQRQSLFSLIEVRNETSGFGFDARK